MSADCRSVLRTALGASEAAHARGLETRQQRYADKNTVRQCVHFNEGSGSRCPNSAHENYSKCLDHY